MVPRVQSLTTAPLLLLTLSSLLTSCGQGGDPPSPPPGSEGASEVSARRTGGSVATGDEYDFSAVDQALCRAAPHTRHLAVVIRHHGDVVYSRAFKGGDEDTPTPAASVAKWLSAATILSLDDAGFLSIDDPIEKYLPRLGRRKGAVTVAQLLSHTSGFTPHGTIAFRSVMGEGMRIGPVARLNRLEASPGSRFCYGRTSFQIAGAIAERVTGQGWGEVFQHRIAGPCGMRNTWFSETRPVLAERACSSANDMSRFMEMILDHGMAPGGERVLSEEMIARMNENHSGDLEIECKPQTYRKGQTYGLGVWRDVTDPTTGEATVVSHNGSSGFKGIVDYCRDSTVSLAARFIEGDGKGARKKAKRRFQKIRRLLRQVIPGPCE